MREMAQLLKSGGPRSERAAHELSIVLAGTFKSSDEHGSASSAALGDFHVGPGGRHDNDQQDFRSIEICPTAGEVRLLYGLDVPALHPASSLPEGMPAPVELHCLLGKENLLAPGKLPWDTKSIRNRCGTGTCGIQTVGLGPLM